MGDSSGLAPLADSQSCTDVGSGVTFVLGWRSIDSDSDGLISWHHYLRTAEDAWLKHDRRA